MASGTWKQIVAVKNIAQLHTTFSDTSNTRLWAASKSGKFSFK